MVFGSLAGEEASVYDSMRAAFRQIDPQQLRVGAGSSPCGGSAKDRLVLLRVRQVFGVAIDGHQAQTPEEGAARLQRGHGLAEAAKQRPYRSHSQLVAAIAQGALAWQERAAVRFRRPQEAQGVGQPVEDCLQRHRGEEAHPDNEEESQLQVQFALPQRAGATLGEHGGHRLARIDLGEYVQAQLGQELARWVHIAYSKGHEVAPGSGPVRHANLTQVTTSLI